MDDQAPPSWDQLDRDYQQHHVDCAICISAGLGYGARCGVGASLWQAYSEAGVWWKDGQ